MIVDDHELVRIGLKSMLLDTEFEVVGEASSGRECLIVAARTSPRIVLLDVRMAGGNGFEALAALKTNFPAVSVLMLSAYGDPTYMARAVAGGASAYLRKGAPAGELVAALRAVARGETLLTREDLFNCLRLVGSVDPDGNELHYPLTPRETEVLVLVSQGLGNRDIAKLLFISESTVRKHVEHIIEKLGVSDRVQAAVWAARHNILDR